MKGRPDQESLLWHKALTVCPELHDMIKERAMLMPVDNDRDVGQRQVYIRALESKRFVDEYGDSAVEVA